MFPPPLSVEAYEYWSIFSLLSRCRGSNEGGPIPIAYTEMLAYLNENGIDHPDQRADAVYFVKFCDGEYRSHVTDDIRAQIQRMKDKSAKS